MLEPDVDAALRHIELITGEYDPVVSLQLFCDADKSRRNLARGMHGRLTAVLPRLVEAQANGCGVFIACNQTDGRRRRKENMVAARVLFIDLDGTPLPARWPWPPELINHTSAVDGVDKFQCWWRIEPFHDFERWAAAQKALAALYGADPKCCLWTQVGRLAGFYHLKRPDRPHMVRTIYDPGADSLPPDAMDDIAEGLGVDMDNLAVDSTTAHDWEAPDHGFDDPADVAEARRFIADRRNWHRTSDGGFSIFKMACALRDLGVSPETAEQLIRAHMPTDADVEAKVANAFRYARSPAGSRSRAALIREFDEMPIDLDWAGGADG